MATNEPEDRVAEELERQLQLAITAAAIAVQRAVAARREALLQAERESQARAQVVRAELAREQAIAEAEIQAVFDHAWWERATPQDAASMWEQAAQWQELGSPDSARTFHEATERINSEASKRWGVDVTELVALAELQELDRTYEAAVEEREHLSRKPEAAVPAEQLDALDTHVETLAAQREGLAQTVGAAASSATPGDVGQQPAEQSRSDVPAREGFDSQGRRTRLGEDLRQAGVPEDAVEARTLADTGQAHEAAEAVRRTPMAGRPTARAGRRAHTRRAQRQR